MAIKVLKREKKAAGQVSGGYPRASFQAPVEKGDRRGGSERCQEIASKRRRFQMGPQRGRKEREENNNQRDGRVDEDHEASDAQG